MFWAHRSGNLSIRRQGVEYRETNSWYLTVVVTAVVFDADTADAKQPTRGGLQCNETFIPTTHIDDVLYVV